jgi:hypothetical protein
MSKSFHHGSPHSYFTWGRARISETYSHHTDIPNDNWGKQRRTLSPSRRRENAKLTTGLISTRTTDGRLPEAQTQHHMKGNCLHFRAVCLETFRGETPDRPAHILRAIKPYIFMTARRIFCLLFWWFVLLRVIWHAEVFLTFIPNIYAYIKSPYFRSFSFQ